MVGHSPNAEADIAKRLTADLEAGGQLVAHGGFTLALEQARDKLAARRLADPQAFVLFLVEAAHLLPGCRGVTFEIGARGSTVVLDGVALTRARARSPLDALFDGADVDEPGVRPLAVAINAMLGLDHRGLSLDLSTSEGGVVHVELPPTGPPTVTEEDRGRASPSLILRVHEQPPGRAWLTMANPEVVDAGARRRELLRTRCKHASIPVQVDGARIDRGPRLEGGSELVEVHEGERLVARGGWPEEAYDQPARALLLANGVIVESVVCPSWRRGFVALVEAGDLRRDVSRTSFVRDESFQDRLAAIRRAHQEVAQALVPLRYDGILQRLGPNRHLPAGIIGVCALISGGIALSLPGLGIGAAFAWAGVCSMWHRRIHGRFDRIKREGRRAIGEVRAVKTGTDVAHLDIELEDRGQRSRVWLELDVGDDSVRERLQVGQRVHLRICRDTGLVLLGRPPP